MANNDKFYRKWNEVDSRPSILSVDQWFETSVNAHLRDETHLPAPAEMLTESKKEDRSNGTCPPGHRANSVALNRNNNNNNNNNIVDAMMLDSSNEEDEL